MILELAVFLSNYVDREDWKKLKGERVCLECNYQREKEIIGSYQVMTGRLRVIESE